MTLKSFTKFSSCLSYHTQFNSLLYRKYSNNSRILSKINIFFPTFTRNKHFKAAVLKEFGGKLEIKEIKSQKKLKENDVRVEVECCAVNVTDSLQCSGEYDVKPKFPFIPGFEFCGTVSEVGSHVKTLFKGDRVIGLNKETFSAMAEECIASKHDLWKIPSDMPCEKATALVDNYATVLLAARRVNLKEGDNVLVTASSGGLGLAAVDIAANLFKAKVIAACDADDTASLLREKGAFSSVLYSKKIVDAVMNETKKEGVKIVFDAVGGDVFKDCMQCLALEGSIVVLGFASRKIPHVNLNQLLPKSSAVIGVSLTHYKNLDKDIYRHTVQEIIDMYLDDFMNPQVVAQFQLDEVNDAFQFIQDRKSTGKVLLNIKS